MKNRKLPFGYALHSGEIVINQCEADAVGDIFRLYTGGASLSGITEMLRSSEISYDAGRLWNKNMVSRILGD
uniref:recombinase family protein n=1 Tax=uncultured Ruminococcus sp. TaxID=165186 RepID=UPI0025DB77F6